jgi:Holliday junction resolvasome RuvABC endonuclease subunit
MLRVRNSGTTKEPPVSKILVAGIDPAMANLGIARMTLDLDNLDLSLEDLSLITTEKQTGKMVRQNSDDLRRARELHAGLHDGLKDCIVAFAEIPSGAQHARSAYGFGMAVGILASATIPLIEVMPRETKLASVGSKTATKQEIIAWAADLYPSGKWLRYQRDFASKTKTRTKGELHEDNEHLADACAVVHAGIKTPEFNRLIAMWKASHPPGK